MFTVSIDNSGDFTSIQAAIDSITEFPAEIFVKKGTYNEVIELRHSDVTIIGEDKDETIITFGNYANMIMEDGSKRGTFRSYTFLIAANNITLKNLTIENSSGWGNDVGQALALFADGNNICVSNCKLLGHQDTLFTGPLPKKEAKPGGFVGPTEFAPRIIGTQLYENCYIEGEVDFIFGSSIAYFDNCDIYCLDKGAEINGYMTAPSTYENCKYGYVFNNCRITGNCPKGTFFLGRPWRIYAKTVLINCEIDDIINELGYSDWKKPESHETSFFAEYNCTGAGADTSRRVAFAHQLTAEQAAEYTKEKVLSYHFEQE